MFSINQVVKGIAGHFIVLGYRKIGFETLVQVKPYNIQTGQAGTGEMALSEDVLTAI